MRSRYTGSITLEDSIWAKPFLDAHDIDGDGRVSLVRAAPSSCALGLRVCRSGRQVPVAQIAVQIACGLHRARGLPRSGCTSGGAHVKPDRGLAPQNEYLYACSRQLRNDPDWCPSPHPL